MEPKVAEKLQELRVHLPFLEDVISRYKTDSEKDDIRRGEQDKFETLHKLLTKDELKMKMETLVKCEKVLVKLRTKMDKNYSFKEVTAENSCPASPPPQDAANEDIPIVPIEIPTERKVSPFDTEHYRKHNDSHSSNRGRERHRGRPIERLEHSQLDEIRDKNFSREVSERDRNFVNKDHHRIKNKDLDHERLGDCSRERERVHSRVRSPSHHRVRVHDRSYESYHRNHGHEESFEQKLARGNISRDRGRFNSHSPTRKQSPSREKNPSRSCSPDKTVEYTKYESLHSRSHHSQHSHNPRNAPDKKTNRPHENNVERSIHGRQEKFNTTWNMDRKDHYRSFSSEGDRLRCEKNHDKRKMIVDPDIFQRRTKNVPLHSTPLPELKVTISPSVIGENDESPYSPEELWSEEAINEEMNAKQSSNKRKSVFDRLGKKVEEGHKIHVSPINGITDVDILKGPPLNDLDLTDLIKECSDGKVNIEDICSRRSPKEVSTFELVRKKLAQVAKSNMDSPASPPLIDSKQANQDPTHNAHANPNSEGAERNIIANSHSANKNMTMASNTATKMNHINILPTINLQDPRLRRQEIVNCGKNLEERYRKSETISMTVSRADPRLQRLQTLGKNNFHQKPVETVGIIYPSPLLKIPAVAHSAQQQHKTSGILARAADVSVAINKASQASNFSYVQFNSKINPSLNDGHERSKYIESKKSKDNKIFTNYGAYRKHKEAEKAAELAAAAKEMNEQKKHNLEIKSKHGNNLESSKDASNDRLNDIPTTESKLDKIYRNSNFSTLKLPNTNISFKIPKKTSSVKSSEAVQIQTDTHVETQNNTTPRKTEPTTDPGTEPVVDQIADFRVRNTEKIDEAKTKEAAAVGIENEQFKSKKNKKKTKSLIEVEISNDAQKESLVNSTNSPAPKQKENSQLKDLEDMSIESESQMSAEIKSERQDKCGTKSEYCTSDISDSKDIVTQIKQEKNEDNEEMEEINQIKKSNINEKDDNLLSTLNEYRNQGDETNIQGINSNKTKKRAGAYYYKIVTAEELLDDDNSQISTKNIITGKRKRQSVNTNENAKKKATIAKKQKATNEDEKPTTDKVGKNKTKEKKKKASSTDPETGSSQSMEGVMTDFTSERSNSVLTIEGEQSQDQSVEESDKNHDSSEEPSRKDDIAEVVKDQTQSDVDEVNRNNGNENSLKKDEDSLPLHLKEVMSNIPNQMDNGNDSTSDESIIDKLEKSESHGHDKVSKAKRRKLNNGNALFLSEGKIDASKKKGRNGRVRLKIKPSPEHSQLTQKGNEDANKSLETMRNEDDLRNAFFGNSDQSEECNDTLQGTLIMETLYDYLLLPNFNIESQMAMYKKRLDPITYKEIERRVRLFKEFQKSSGNVASNAENGQCTKKKKGELERLSEDIGEMYIGAEILTLTGRRRANRKSVNPTEGTPNSVKNNGKGEKETKPRVRRISSTSTTESIKTRNVQVRLMRSKYGLAEDNPIENDKELNDLPSVSGVSKFGKTNKLKSKVKSKVKGRIKRKTFVGPKSAKAAFLTNNKNGLDRQSGEKQQNHERTSNVDSDEGENFEVVQENELEEEEDEELEDEEEEEEDEEEDEEDEEDELSSGDSIEEDNNSNVPKKNTDASWHCQSKYNQICGICNTRQKQVVEHYVQMHGECYISRFIPSMLKEYRKYMDKFSAPKFGIKMRNINKWYHNCSFCLKQYEFTNKEWIRHYKSHTGEYDFKCSKCSKPFMRFNRLQNHIRDVCPGAEAISNHLEIDTYCKDVIIVHVCNLCNFMQLSRKNMNKHYYVQHENSAPMVAKAGYTMPLLNFEGVSIVDEETAIIYKQQELMKFDIYIDPVKKRHSNEKDEIRDEDFPKLESEELNNIDYDEELENERMIQSIVDAFEKPIGDISSDDCEANLVEVLAELEQQHSLDGVESPTKIPISGSGIDAVERLALHLQEDESDKSVLNSSSNGVDSSVDNTSELTSLDEMIRSVGNLINPEVYLGNFSQSNFNGATFSAGKPIGEQLEERKADVSNQSNSNVETTSAMESCKDDVIELVDKNFTETVSTESDNNVQGPNHDCADNLEDSLGVDKANNVKLVPLSNNENEQKHNEINEPNIKTLNISESEAVEENEEDWEDIEVTDNSHKLSSLTKQSKLRLRNIRKINGLYVNKNSSAKKDKKSLQATVRKSIKKIDVEPKVKGGYVPKALLQPKSQDTPVIKLDKLSNSVPGPNSESDLLLKLPTTILDSIGLEDIEHDVARQINSTDNPCATQQLSPEICNINENQRPIVGFKPLITCLEDTSDGLTEVDPIDLMPHLNPASPLVNLHDTELFLNILSTNNTNDNVRSQIADNTYKKQSIQNIAFSMSSNKLNMKFYCLIDNCTFLFSDDSNGLSAHFKIEHNSTKWNGFCNICNKSIGDNEDGYGIAMEIEHMLEEHVHKIEIEPNRASNDTSKKTRISVRKLSGDCLTEAIDLHTQQPSLLDMLNTSSTSKTSNCYSPSMTSQESYVNLNLKEVLTSKSTPSTLHTSQGNSRTPLHFNMGAGEETLKMALNESQSTQKSALKIATVQSLNQKYYVERDPISDANQPTSIANACDQSSEQHINIVTSTASLPVNETNSGPFIIKSTMSHDKGYGIEIMLNTQPGSENRTEALEKEFFKKPIICCYVACKFEATHVTALREHLDKIHSVKRNSLKKCNQCVYKAGKHEDFLAHVMKTHLKSNDFNIKSQPPKKSTTTNLKRILPKSPPPMIPLSSSSAISTLPSSSRTSQIKTNSSISVPSVVPVSSSPISVKHSTPNVMSPQLVQPSLMSLPVSGASNTPTLTALLKNSQSSIKLSSPPPMVPLVSTHSGSLVASNTSVTPKLSTVDEVAKKIREIMNRKNEVTPSANPDVEPNIVPVQKETSSIDTVSLIKKTVEEIKKATGIADADLFSCIYDCPEPLTEKDFAYHLRHLHIKRDKTYKCKHCADQCQNIMELRNHIRDHKGHCFFCYICFESGPNLETLLKHFREAHSCNKNVKTKAVFDKTLEATESEALSNSEKDVPLFYICHSLFLNQKQILEFGSKLSQHWLRKKASLKKHFDPSEINLLPTNHIFKDQLYCIVCNYGSKVRNNLMRHLQMHNTGEAVEKIVSHDPVNPVPCLNNKEKHFDKMMNLASASVLKVLSQSKDADSKKKKTKNENSVLLEKNPELKYVFVEATKRYTCGVSDCNALTITEDLFRSHLNAFHSNISKYSCPTCNEQICKSFSLEKIIQHLRFHSNKLYQCSCCDYLHYLRKVVQKHIRDKHSDCENPPNLIAYTRNEPGELEGQKAIESYKGNDTSKSKNPQGVSPNTDKQPWCKKQRREEPSLSSMPNRITSSDTKFDVSKLDVKKNPK